MSEAVSKAAAPRWSGWDYAAVLLLPFGGLILPFVGWLVAVAMLWSSPSWPRKDKVLGTAALPGGLMLFALLSIALVQPEGPVRPWDVVLFVVWIASLVIPLVTVAYLVRRLRARPVAG